MLEHPRILIVDDEKSMREMVSILLERHNYQTTAARSGNEAIALLESGERFDAIVTDLLMDDGDGLSLLQKTKELDPSCEVILITAFGTAETAVEAMKKGAFDYVTKPFNVDEFLIIMEQALERRQLIEENIALRSRVRGEHRFADLVGKSAPMRQVIDLCHRVMDTAATVLISGESGTGKEMVARALHYTSKRAGYPFVAVNCGALPEHLMESELFGHTKGSFTGAIDDKTGLFASAAEGTIFLDEIGELPPRLQVKMLRVLQEHAVRPVGSNEELPVDVRVIAATNQDLESKINSGEFRKDLYYRLNVIHFQLPPLRQRKEDISPLIDQFLKRFAVREGQPIKNLLGSTRRLLLDYHYPGNVRELSNILERAITLSPGHTVDADVLPREVYALAPMPSIAPVEIPQEGLELESYLIDLERGAIEQALRRSGGVQAQAAALLGLTPRSLRYRMNKLGI